MFNRLVEVYPKWPSWWWFARIAVARIDGRMRRADCSAKERCRLIDLGAWLDGDYRISDEENDDPASVGIADDDEQGAD